jgi:hypothetical protein
MYTTSLFEEKQQNRLTPTTQTWLQHWQWARAAPGFLVQMELFCFLQKNNAILKNNKVDLDNLLQRFSITTDKVSLKIQFYIAASPPLLVLSKLGSTPCCPHVFVRLYNYV